MTKAKVVWDSRFHHLAEKMREAAYVAVSRASVQIVQRAKEMVLVDTSSLQRTIHAEEDVRDLNVIRSYVIAGDETAIRLGYDYPVYYAPHVEYMYKPFLTPAAQSVNLAREVAEAVKEEVK